MNRHCRRCGKRLSDPASIDAGKGPECQAKAPTPREDLYNSAQVLVEKAEDPQKRQGVLVQQYLDRGERVPARLRSQVLFWAPRVVA